MRKKVKRGSTDIGRGKGEGRGEGGKEKGGDEGKKGCKEKGG